ncbi:MAG: ATP-binding protein [Planctomycetota bacterium]
MDQPRPEPGPPPGLLSALGTAVFEETRRGRFRRLGDVPEWYGRFFDAAPTDVRLTEHLVFLSSFLVDARQAWAGSGETVRSGSWSEPDRDGVECHFEAVALGHEGRHLLLVEFLGEVFDERRDELQRAREGKLDSYRRLQDERRVTERLWDVKDELEREVGRRTRELVEANQLLKREIEQRRVLEERASTLRDQLAHAARLGTMGEMAAMIAHELNQPLGAVLNYMQGCQRILDVEPPDLARVREAVEKSAAQAERAGRIVSNLRSLTSKGRSERVRCGIGPLLREVLELLEFEIRRNGIELRLEIETDLPRIVADPVQVQQVLVNLVKNAVEAASDPAARGREVLVEAAARDEGVIAVIVSDRGPGFDGDLERLFEPYFTTKDGGMGMGLAICRSIAESHAGGVKASRNDSGGLTFEFILPHEIAEES